ncbi:MAG: hypothetical protein M3Z09_15595 [Acidobacteriota bacterium]|nr:hypothetical protein [Acidobacteriota bacterium]
MRLLISLLFATTLTAQGFGYAVLNSDPGPWPEILSSIGLLQTAAPEASVFVARSGTPTAPEWPRRLSTGAFLILEGDSPLARSFGFRRLDHTTRLVSVIDVHQPRLPLIFEHPIELTEPSVPAEAQVFARERWTNVPVIAGFRRGAGGVLWVAASPGAHGYERFPFLPQALVGLGFEPPFRGNRLWAFFDYSYRARVDVNWFAKRWHAAGISALQVAAWHFYDRDPERDLYLQRLIKACHREGVLVYAWLELPHVSEQFWNEHPEWREKTALLQDAQLDWRKLMNLADPDCTRAVRSGTKSLMNRFDWDGLNLAELYYESLEGASNPARFTPMNDTVRKQFQSTPGGFDPVELWSTRKDPASLHLFLEFRAHLARMLQEDWLREAELYRTSKPDLDIVLTHVDDRLDTGMRDAIGADTSSLPLLLRSHEFTFLIEDPATVWNQGPQRYPIIASKYPTTSKLGIDINVVERYQDVYPTKQQAGLELFGLVHLASQAFPRVALYIENSIESADLPFIGPASSGVTKAAWIGPRLFVDSKYGTSVQWQGPALVDDRLWPVADTERAWLPSGPHTIQKSSSNPPLLLSSLNATLITAVAAPASIEFSYRSDSRAIASFDRNVRALSVDGVGQVVRAPQEVFLLPRGRHSVIAWPQADESGGRKTGHPGQVVLSNRGSK